ncbi:spore coat protein GerQ [Oceanobacillus salinisoli]|uniref:spore coat protein GerQ n=1 Tax=Oceanobacillus salinisoli TaxID=2678611 RepID=UPI0012E1D98B|nr:spore coat protein GerQ [Oceanobacillus salinisoli]
MSENNVYQPYGSFYPTPAYPYYFYPAYGMRQYPAGAYAGYPYQQGQNQPAQPTQPVQQQPQPTQTQQQQPVSEVPGMLPLQQSYIENILRLNKGKLVTVYMTFENNTEWNAMTFTGIIEAAGRDHIILSDPDTGRRYLLLMVYLDYVVFDEEINYEYPFAGGQLSTYQPR